MAIVVGRLIRMAPYLGELPPISRRIKTLFDENYYRATYPDISAAWVNPFGHFMIWGAFEARNPHPLFDTAFYLQKYPDVAASNVNPLAHYMKHGAAEGRWPHPFFNPSWKGFQGANPLLHYLQSQPRRQPPDPLYALWLQYENHEAPPPPAISPRFSILLQITQPHREWLQEAIASVCGQSYPCWELCLCVNGPTEPWLAEYLAATERSDPRIRVTRLPQALAAATALNHAAALATGDYLAVLDQHDRLAPDALQWVAAKTPADLIYSDEDRLDEQGRRFDPVFKPDWSPDLLLSSRYTGHIMAVSRAVWERAGGFRARYDTVRDFDLALRSTSAAVRVQHVSNILYHARKTGWLEERETSEPGRLCLEEALLERGAAAEVDCNPRSHRYEIRWKSSGTAMASLIICSGTPRLLDQCLQSLEARTAYPRREVVVVQHLRQDDSDWEAVIARHAAKSVTYSGPFNFSRMCNSGARAASGQVLVFLNDDVEALDPSWLERLVAQVERPDVGAAGARLIYPSGTLQHAGVAVGIGDGCGHIGRGVLRSPYWPWLDSTRDVSAVTGACLAIRAPLFRELDGFSEEFPINYNDIDLCLRVREAGYRVIYDAGVTLMHYECQTRLGGVTDHERESWRDRWSGIMTAGDPFYTPHLTVEREDLSLRIPRGGEPRRKV